MLFLEHLRPTVKNKVCSFAESLNEGWRLVF